MVPAPITQRQADLLRPASSTERVLYGQPEPHSETLSRSKPEKEEGGEVAVDSEEELLPDGPFTDLQISLKMRLFNPF